MPKTSDKIAYRVPEAATVMGIGRTNLYAEIRAGRLRAIKAGGRRLILKTDIDAYFVSRQVAA